MTVGYIDTSLVVGMAFDEPRAKRVSRRLGVVKSLCSSSLLEAEFLSTAEREGVRDGARRTLAHIKLVFPDRALSAEIDQVLSHGYLRGADLHHLATALFLFGKARDGYFLTLDARQQEIADALGFLGVRDLG